MDKPPYMKDFIDLVEDEFHGQQGWRIAHTQYFRKNFFLVEFVEAEVRDVALKYTPWFYGCKYMYTFPWVPDFDVTIGHYNMLHV